MPRSSRMVDGICQTGRKGIYDDDQWVLLLFWSCEHELKREICHSQPVKVIDYGMVFNKLGTRKNKRARTSQAQAQAQEEDDEYAFINELEILDDQIEEIPVQEERNEDEMPKWLREPKLPTFTFEES